MFFAILLDLLILGLHDWDLWILGLHDWDFWPFLGVCCYCICICFLYHKCDLLNNSILKFLLQVCKIWFFIICGSRLVGLSFILTSSEIFFCLFIGLVEIDPEGALSGFTEVLHMEQDKAEW